MPDITPQSNPQLPTDPLLARFFLTPEQKADKEKGKAIVKAIYALQTANDTNLNYFKGRNARWINNLLWAKGSQPMQEFLGYMSVSDANKAWVNIDVTQSRLAAQFTGTLIESMAKTKMYPCVRAIDDGSLSEKEERYQDAIYRMNNVKTISQVQEASGIQVEPPDAYVPDDELAARVHFELEDRLPKEIRFEKICGKVQNDIHFEKILNRKTISDLIILNCAATKIERLAPGKYTVKKIVPTNLVFNFFLNDSGKYQITQAGEFYNVKVRDFRRQYLKTPDNPGGLDEKQIFELAKLSTNKSIGVFNYMWNDNWAYNTFNFNRPYDDCSILVFDCEVDCGEDVYFVEKSDAFGRMNIAQKKNAPYQQTTKDGRIIEQPKPDDVNIIKRQKNTWWRGVYCPYGDVMIYWGRPDIIINQYTDVYKPLSSYTIIIPNNDGEYIPSLFERIMEPLREYQITKLKRKQLIALVEPDGFRIDVESARNIDLGNGNSIPWEEVVKIKLQTGIEIWSSKGIDPLSREAPPISAGTQSTNISKIIELTQVLASIIAEIRQLIGVPMYRDGSDVGDRTAAALAEGQNQSSYNVTDFILNADNELWQETFNKICLLHWNDIVKAEPESKNDLINTRFDVSVKMKPTEYQKQVLEADIQRYSQMPDAQGNPSLSLKDAMFIRDIDDYKLAQWYLSHIFETNRRRAIDDSTRLQQQNMQVQQQSAMQKAQSDMQLQAQKLDADKQMREYEALQQMKVAIVTGSFQIAAKGENAAFPPWLAPILQQLVPNIALPIAAENAEMRQAIQQQQMAQIANQQQEQQAQQQPEMQPDQQQGQPQLVNQ